MSQRRSVPKGQLIVILLLYLFMLIATVIGNFTDSILDRRLQFGDEGTVALILGATFLMGVVSYLFLKGKKLAIALGYMFLCINIFPDTYYLWKVGFRFNLGTFLSLFTIGCILVILVYQRNDKLRAWFTEK